MAWEIEFTDEFGDWWNGLDEAEQVKTRLKKEEQFEPWILR